MPAWKHLGMRSMGSGANPWGAEAWAAARSVLLPPNDPRASLAAGLQAGALGVDVTAAGVQARVAATAPAAADRAAATGRLVA
eukprot:784391-Alexandrium_andersonii.AAC.1